MYLCLISAGMGICALHGCMGHQKNSRAPDFIIRISAEITRCFALLQSSLYILVGREVCRYICYIKMSTNYVVNEMFPRKKNK